MLGSVGVDGFELCPSFTYPVRAAAPTSIGWWKADWMHVAGLCTLLLDKKFLFINIF